MSKSFRMNPRVTAFILSPKAFLKGFNLHCSNSKLQLGDVSQYVLFDCGWKVLFNF